jgi:hypothetical protein
VQDVEIPLEANQPYGSHEIPQKSSENVCVQPKVKGLNHSNMDVAATYNHD